MSLTRIGSIGINTGIAFAGVTTIVTLNTANDALSIGATVNVGSGITLGASGDIFATGVSTVTTLKVGSGVTVSSDGDVFATGVTTSTTFSGAFSGSGANITALNASNISSGTVPTARLGSGTASSSTFLRGDSTFQTVNTDLVSDTSPQLGGNLETNDKNIVFGDSSGATVNRLALGAGTDFSIYHNGTNTILDNNTGNLTIETTANEVHNVQSEFQVKVKGGDEDGLKVITDGAVELYYDNSKKFETNNEGVKVNGFLEMLDNQRIQMGDGDDLQIYHDGSHSRLVDAGTGHLIIQTSELDLMNAAGTEDMIKATENGAVELYHDNTKRLETTSSGARVSHTGDAQLQILADTDNNGGNNWPHIEFRVDNTSGSAEARIAYRQDNSVLKFDIAGSEKVGVNANGLVFNGDTAAANALNDYEEGTFTPTLGYSTTQNNPTYTTQAGQYTKIGNVVTFQARVNISNKGSGSGNVKVGGLPFGASTSTIGNQMVQASAIIGMDLGGDRELFVQFEGSNSTTLFLYHFAIESSVDYGTVDSSKIDNDMQLNVRGTYFTDS